MEEYRLISKYVRLRGSNSKNICRLIYVFILFKSLPVVLYGCETWSLRLGEEHRLRVFEGTVLREIFVPETDEVKGSWRTLRMKSFIIYTIRQEKLE
jgi:hypothetical protein